MKIYLILPLLLSSLAFAQENSENGRPCAADREKFCHGIAPGGGAILKCLREHESELSAPCKAMGEKMKEKRENKREERKAKMQEAKEACGGDVQKFCKDVKPGGGAIVKCLRSHEAEVSEACRHTFADKK